MRNNVTKGYGFDIRYLETRDFQIVPQIIKIVVTVLNFYKKIHKEPVITKFSTWDDASKVRKETVNNANLIQN